MMLLAATAAHADAALQEFVDKTLTDLRARADLPAMAALVQVGERIEAQSAIGVRAVGHPQKVTLQDLWHLGSDTKSMTATLLARLVEQGFLRYDDTLARMFPGVAARMDPALHDVTLQQLLSHTSGLPTLTRPEQLPALRAIIKSEKGVRAQRAAIAEFYLERKPATPPGEFSYSNLGYIIAGAAAEQRTGRSWEDLIRSEVWKPLGIRSGGFGPPGKSGRFDQPLGHDRVDGQWIAQEPGRAESDNPVAAGPAGTVHMSLQDWLTFARDQLDGEQGRGKLLTRENYRRLHQPVAKNYALGWGVFRGADGSPALLMHTGSNGYWVADVRMAPKRDTIVLIATNAGGEQAEKADKELGRALLEHLGLLD
jgi:CubicO group peptidase (beta-lactamase class C family)